MKKTICILLCACMLLCLAACGEKAQRPREPENNATTAPQTTPEPTTNQAGGDTGELRLLALEKTLHTYYEWADELPQALVRSENSCITLGQADAQAFPEMAQALSQSAALQENAMLDEFDNLVSFAREELQAGREGFETYVSILDVQVRRADSLVISLLTDSYSHYGQIENYRVFHGSNYDTQTGAELLLSDVVTVSNDLAKAVEKALTTSVWAGDFYSESAVEDYFANTPYDGFSWTIDYFGLTFYFSPGDLSPDGMLTATVPFSEYPELFNEKYLAAPAEYAAEIPLDISFFAQLDTDGALEAISVSGWYDGEQNRYRDYGIYTDTDGQYFFEECFVYDLHPYFVKTAKGNFVYLFCEDFQEGWRHMELVVFALNADGSVTKLGQMNVSPAWLADNRFLIPTDPACLILDDLASGAQSAKFTVGNDGMPTR